MRRRDGNESSELTASPMVQRFLLSVALVLASHQALGRMHGGSGVRPSRSGRHQSHLATDTGGLDTGGLDTGGRPLLAVDLNQASAEELTLLPGIGPVAAKAITESRRAEGPFFAVVDLARVHGIGPKTVQAVRPYLLPLPKDAERTASSNP